MGADDLTSVPAHDPGDAFEEDCWNLLRRHYEPGELVRIPAALGGDYGIEGFSTDGIAYQCYADRDSLTLRHRTDKQKQKLYRDIQKLKSNASDLESTLDGVALANYFLMVPQYDAAELVTYAAELSRKVREWGLPFIAGSFAIRIKTPADYPAELAVSLRDGTVKAIVPLPEVDAQSIAQFPGEKPDLVLVLDGKLEMLGVAGQRVGIATLRDRMIRHYLEGEQVRRSLLDWPGIWEDVERCRILREKKLEWESDLSQDAPAPRVLGLMSDYEHELVSSVAGIRQGDARLLALAQVADWLMRCPLSFGVAL
jgi:hypothetical protein